jgi:tetratricopeptide (TPR) repeat protein
MRRFALVCLAVLVLAGCGRQDPPPPDVGATPTPVPIGPAASTPDDRQPVVAVADKVAEPAALDLPQASKQERYDAALVDALNLLAERRLTPALEALRAAQQIQDTEQVQRLMDRIQGLIAEAKAAEQTAGDLRDAINDGKADEAARLAGTALAQYEGSGSATDLASVKREADAVVTASAPDVADRARRLRTDALAALADNNLRAAAIALEQAVQLAEDEGTRRKLDDVQRRLSRYDDNLRQAREFRRDPSRLEDAVAALQEAARAWDTLQVRQELDDYNLALQKRRDRVAVADFEVRGDLGIAAIGRTAAEQLLPSLKPRFDVVERTQVGRVLEELKLEAGNLVDQPAGRQEFGRLAGVRYVVVGSLTPLCGITAQARLVEVPTGLVVQTARISAVNTETLVARLPLLGQMLQMSDEQKLAFEQAQALKAAEVTPIAIANLPPPPPLPAADQPLPPPLVTFTARAPAFGGLIIADFQALPPVVAAGPPPVAEVVIVREQPRRRLLALSLELGDNLFRRGRYREAHSHFQLALGLNIGNADIQLRIDRCRPYLPPPPAAPVVVVGAPAVVVQAPIVRPRVVVFNFLLNSDPGLVPPNVGDWAADQFGACFGSTYEIVERGEVCWYMGRLGVTMREVLTDSSSRIALAQALNARFFVFGAIEQTSSFNVTTHLIDAQTGARTGTAAIHVQDHQELKLRMNELVRQINGKPAEQEQLAQQGKNSEKALTEARKLLKAGSFTQAAATARSALKDNPDNTALQSVKQEAEQKARQVALAQAQQREAEARKAQLAAQEQRQRELARQAEAARQQAQEEAKRQGEAARRAQQMQKEKAAAQLRAQADKALKEGNPAQAVVALQSAAALKPGEDISRDLARARIEQEKAAQQRAAQEQARKDAETRRQREAAQARVDAERKGREAADAERLKARAEKDRADSARLVEQARQQIAKKDYAKAVASLLAARGLNAGTEIDRLMQQAKEAQALEEARTKGDQARTETERRLAEEKAQRDRADAETRKKQADYLAALQQGQKALGAKRYDEAIRAFDEAAKLFRTDAVVNGRKSAEELRDRDRAQRDAEARRQQEEQQRGQRVRALLADGRQATAAGQYDKAIGLLREASSLAPADVEVRTALSRAEQARDAARKPPPPNPAAEYGKAMQAGAALEKQKKYADAAQAYRTALRWQPKDARAANAFRTAEYQQHMAEGDKLLIARRFKDAAREFEEALKLIPTSVDAKRSLERARSGK